MQKLDYHKNIVDYYEATENAYKDSWDLNNSLAIHYGYWDKKVSTFPESLLRMNEVMIERANIKKEDLVLDAGCGIGGSSLFIASTVGARVKGISLSEKQVSKAKLLAAERKLEQLVDFEVMNYSSTSFPGESFDVVWGCESICYADDKNDFIKEAFRLLKPGGRLIVADGFVNNYEDNQHPVIRKWLDGWLVNYLETPGRFDGFMRQAGFAETRYQDISKEIKYSSRRLYRFYFLASMYVLWKKISFSNRVNDLHKGNIRACRYQYEGMKKGLWQYGLITGHKPR